MNAASRRARSHVVFEERTLAAVALPSGGPGSSHALSTHLPDCSRRLQRRRQEDVVASFVPAHSVAAQHGRELSTDSPEAVGYPDANWLPARCHQTRFWATFGAV